jgi:hypothetical protein
MDIEFQPLPTWTRKVVQWGCGCWFAYDGADHPLNTSPIAGCTCLYCGCPLPYAWSNSGEVSGVRLGHTDPLPSPTMIDIDELCS